MHKYRELKVWAKSYDFSLEIYKITREFPKSEMYGLTSQLRRASISIPANIAEGCGRYSQKDFTRFLQISFGSSNEVEVFLSIAKDLGYLSEGDYIMLEKSLTEIRKMLSGLIANTLKV